MGPPPDILHHGGIIQAVCGKKIGRPLAAECRRPHAAKARHLVVGGADPQRRIPALAQPVRQTDVVRVHVCGNHAQHRQAIEFIGKNGFPLGLGSVVVDTAIDNAPTLRATDLVTQQPQVDVVEHKGQRHAYPLDARRHGDAVAGVGEGVAQGVMQLQFQIVHS